MTDYVDFNNCKSKAEGVVLEAICLLGHVCLRCFFLPVIFESISYNETRMNSLQEEIKSIIALNLDSICAPHLSS